MSTRGRLVFGVFVVALMNATLQPCLMAMESSQEIASISALAEHDDHHGHSEHTAGHLDQACLHCPPTAAHNGESCAVAAIADCDVLPKTKLGERGLKSDFSDSFGATHSFYYYVSPDPAPAEIVVVSLDCSDPKFSVGPSVSIRNCVFLK